MPSYRHTPPDTAAMPGGIPYIIGNELAERFSFYGMKGILTVFMTKHLLDSSGQPAYMGDEEAKTIYHLFTAAAYFFPLVGSLISDIFWGKFKTIMILSLGYCLGHACLAVMDLGPLTGAFDMMPWLLIGLLFIAVGAGGIKPCVSAHVGDQFGRKNQHMLSKVFSWFYFAINVGAATSTLLTPVLLVKVGPWAAFGLPGVLMAIATLVFWMGRHKFVHIKPAGWRQFTAETFSPDGLRALRNLAPIFLIFIPMFWALFDQTGSAWVIQADRMDRRFMGVTWYDAQIQAANPIFILILIPIFAYVIYPLLDRNVLKMTPLRKMGMGLFLTVFAFSISAWIEMRIQANAAVAAANLWSVLGAQGEASFAGLQEALRLARDRNVDETTISAALDVMPNISMQIIAYIALTAAEVMVSITSLEFAYTQAPRKMKSFIMGVYFLGISLGNLFTSGVNYFIQEPGGGTRLEGASYYWFFTGLMLITAFAFVVFSMYYKGSTFIQGNEELASPTCPSCGYDLTGNISSHCPECGQPVDSPVSPPPQ